MGWRDDIAMFEQNRRYQSWIEERSYDATPQVADSLAYALQGAENLPPEATVSLVLGGADYNLIEQANIAAARSMIRLGQGADGSSFRNNAAVNENEDDNILSKIGDNLFDTAKMVSRTAFLAGDSFVESAVGLLGIPLGAPGFVERVKSDGISGLADYLMEIPTSTSLWEAGSQLFTEGEVNIGSGWFVGGDVETGQAERQRALVGTVQGPGGPSAWTPGRGLASALTETGIIDEESWAWNLTSGIVDAAVAVVADPSNLIPGIGWGDELIQGVRTVGSRRVNRYVDFITQADRAQSAGDIAAATRLRTRAMDTLGANTMFRGFDNMNPQQVALRDVIMREAGMLGPSESKAVNPAQFLSFLTKRSGRNLVEKMIEEKNINRIMQLHKYKIGPRAAQDLADARTADDVVATYLRAFTNPGEDLENFVAAVPSLGLFRKSEAGLWIRRNINAHTRLLKMMPETSVASVSKPQQYVATLKQLTDVFPIGAQPTGVLAPEGAKLAKGVARYNLDLQDKLIDRAVRVLNSGDQAEIYSFTNEVANTFAQMFKNLGYTDEMVSTLTTWRSTADSYQRFAQNTLKSGEKLNRIPLLVSQLISGDVLMIDPKQLVDMVRQSGRLNQYIRTNSRTARNWWSKNDELIDLRAQLADAEQAGDVKEATRLAQRVRRANDELSKLRNPDDALPLQIKKGVTLAADFTLSAVWKPLQLIRAAFISRVVGEEFVRVLASGTFGGRDRFLDYVMATTNWGGRYQLDAVGRRFNAVASDADNLINAKADLVDELNELRKLAPETGSRKIAGLQKQIKDLDVQIERIMDEAFNAEETFHRGLLNKNAGLAYDSIVKNPKRIMYQSGQASVVSKIEDLQSVQWREAFINHLLKFNADPVMREIARGVDNAATITIDGFTDTVMNHMRRNPLLRNEELVTSWLMTNDAGITQLNKMADAYRVKGLQFDPNNVDDVRRWVDQMHDELLYFVGGKRDVNGVITGANDDLLNVVARGEFRGDNLQFTDYRNNVRQFNSFFENYVDEWRLSPDAPDLIEHIGESIYGEARRNVMDRIAGWFFSGLYGTSSDKLARSPTFRRVYWKQMSELVDLASPDLARQLVENAKAAKIQPRLIKNMEARAKVASGNVVDLQELDDIAKANALAAVRDLLFDASKRSATFDQMRLIMPFGDAWKEVMQTWGRLFVNQRGANFYRGLRNAEAAMGADAGPFGPGDLYGIDPLTGEYTATPDGLREGFVYTDPTSKEKRIMTPWSRQLSKLFAGSEYPGMDLGIPVQNLSIMGGVLPGIGPVADRLVNNIVPETPDYDWLRKLLFPFGEPSDPATEAGRESLTGLVIPAWAKKVSALVPREGFAGWVANLINDIQDDPAFISTQSQVYSQLVSTGQYGMGFAEQQRAQRDAETIARKLYGFRGLVQFAAPGSPLSQYMAETEDGDVLAALLVDQLRDMENALIDQGQPPDLALSVILDTYGPDVWLYSAPNSTSEYKGVAARDSWFDWYRTGLNREAVRRYDLFGAFFGPDDGEFSLDAFSRMREDGLSEPATPAERYAMAARSLGYLAYNRFRRGLPPETQRTNLDRIMLARLRDNIEVTFNIDLESAERRSERERQINQAREIVRAADAGDELAGSLMSQSGADSLRIYIEARDRIERMASEELGVVNWQQAKRTAPMREYLRKLADRLSQQDAVFSKMFQFVFDGEMLDDLEVSG